MSFGLLPGHLGIFRRTSFFRRLPLRNCNRPLTVAIYHMPRPAHLARVSGARATRFLTEMRSPPSLQGERRYGAGLVGAAICGCVRPSMALCETLAQSRGLGAPKGGWKVGRIHVAKPRRVGHPFATYSASKVSITIISLTKLQSFVTKSKPATNNYGHHRHQARLRLRRCVPH